ncbi:MAG: hypothetical protein SOI66_07140 [Bifidobacterium sp.]
MDTRERWQAEEEHDERIRLISQAEEQVNDYQHEFNQKTSNLVDYVQSFYRNQPANETNTYNDQFQQAYEEYNRQTRRTLEQLDEVREQEQRDYARKLDEYQSDMHWVLFLFFTRYPAVLESV